MCMVTGRRMNRCLKLVWFLYFSQQQCFANNDKKEFLEIKTYCYNSSNDIQLIPNGTQFRFRCFYDNNMKNQSNQTNRCSEIYTVSMQKRLKKEDTQFNSTFPRVLSTKDELTNTFNDVSTRKVYICELSLKENQQFSKLLQFCKNTSNINLSVMKGALISENNRIHHLVSCTRASNCSQNGMKHSSKNSSNHCIRHLLRIEYDQSKLKTRKKIKTKEVPRIETLEQYCKLLRISKSNCVCSNEKLSELFWCLKEKPTTYTYNKTLSRLYAALVITFSILGIMGNALVLAVAKSKRELPTCQKLIASLALCDFVFSVFQFVQGFRNFWTNTWIYGSFLCKITYGFEQLGTCFAMGIILVISIERYIGITNPFSRGLSVKHFRILMVVNIIYGIIATMPLFLFYTTEGREEKVCLLKWPEKSQQTLKIYRIIILVVFFAIPLCVVIALYVRVALSLIGNVRVFKDVVFDDHAFKERASDTRRAILIMVSIVTAFIICVLPQHAVELYFELLPKNGDAYDGEIIGIKTYYYLNMLMKFPYPLHVAINPIIYSVIDSKWRKDVIKVVFGSCSRGRGPSRSMNATMDMDLNRTRSHTSAVFYPSPTLPSRNDYTRRTVVQEGDEHLPKKVNQSSN